MSIKRARVETARLALRQTLLMADGGRCTGAGGRETVSKQRSLRGWKMAPVTRLTVAAVAALATISALAVVVWQHASTVELVPTLARTEQLNGLSALLPRTRMNSGLTPKQLAVLRSDSEQLVNDFFGGKKAVGIGAPRPRAVGTGEESAMAMAGQRPANQRGGLMSVSRAIYHHQPAQKTGVEAMAAAAAKRRKEERSAKRMPSQAITDKLIKERAEAQTFSQEGNKRMAAVKKAEARRLALKVDGSLPVTEEGELLASSERRYVNQLEHDMEHGVGPARRGSQDSALKREEARLEADALHTGAAELGVAPHALEHSVRARLYTAKHRQTQHKAAGSEGNRAADAVALKREEARLEAQAMHTGASELGVPPRALERRVRARMRNASRRRMQHKAGRGGGGGGGGGHRAVALDINMLGAHRKVGPQHSGTVAQSELETMDDLIFGTPMQHLPKAHKPRLPGVHLWGLSESPDLKQAAKTSWAKDAVAMHLKHAGAHGHGDSAAMLRAGVWSGHEGEKAGNGAAPRAEKTARLQQLLQASTVLDSTRSSTLWPAGHAADERVAVSARAARGAEDFSASGLLRPLASLDPDSPRPGRADGGYVVSREAARGMPREGVVRGLGPAMMRAYGSRESDVGNVQSRRPQEAAAHAARSGEEMDEGVAQVMLAAMGKDPEPYEERRLARAARSDAADARRSEGGGGGARSSGLLQMMKGVWAGEGDVGAEWSRCTPGEEGCPSVEDGGYGAVEPANHVSGEYHAPRYPADPVRAHYGKRLNAAADARDYYNDDVVTPMRRNRIEEPEHPDPSYHEIEYKSHPGYDPDNETAVAAYPHLVRWDKEKWKEAAAADGEGEGEEEEGGGDAEGEGGEEAETPEEQREEEREEEQETGLRPGTLTMQGGRQRKNVTWEGIARRRLNDTFSGRPGEDGSNPWNVDDLDDRDDQDGEDFVEYEPQHMRMKSLDGYYKTTPSRFLDFEGVHPWDKAEADQADIPNNEFRTDMDSQTEEGHLPGVLVDSWGAAAADAQTKPSAENEFVPSEPRSERIARRHRVVISDQEMNEHIGTGGFWGRDQGGGTDETWVPYHHVHRNLYPASADPAVDLSGNVEWH